MKVYHRPALEFFVNSFANVMYVSNFAQETITKDPFDFSRGVYENNN